MRNSWVVLTGMKTEVMPKTLIPQTKPYIPEEDIIGLLAAFREILESGQLINGRYTQMFEEKTAKALGVKYAVAMNSCTSALETMLDYIDMRDREVIVPVNTFLASANAVLFAGGKPVLVDIAEDLLIDFEKLKAAVNEKTKAVMIVHLAGYIHPQIEEIKAFCRERGIYLLEDAAHAHGASLKGIQAGAWGDAGAFSYYATKVMATGVGGMLTTNDEGLAARARSLRFHGEDTTRGIQDRLGRDWLMTEFQAAMGVFQLARLPEAVEKRMAIAKEYDAAFTGISGISIFPLPNSAISGYYKYPVRILEPFKKEEIKLYLEKEEGIKVGNAYWPPCHLQPAYKNLFGYKEGDFPVAEKVLSETISLPLYPDMTDEEVGRVIQALHSAVL